MRETNLKQELIDNGDQVLDFSRPADVEHVLGEMIISRSDCAGEIAERVAAFVEMLRPEHAFIVFGEATRYAKARLDDIRQKDFDVIETYDTVIAGLTPWLKQQGYPTRHLKDDTQLRDDDRLFMEILARCPGATDDELIVLFEGAVEACGNATAAVEALKRNKLVAELIEFEGERTVTKSTTYWHEEDHVSTILETYENLEDAALNAAYLVTRLEPTDAYDVYWRACELASARTYEIENDNEYVELFDTILNPLTRWLEEQGFPAPRRLNDNEKGTNQ